MATLTYDPSDDPQMLEADEARDAESLEIGERLEQQQQELLAGKFRDASELEQAYIELQKKLGSKDSDPEPEQEVEEAPQEEEQDSTVALLSDASAEYAKNGELSEETLQAFSKMSSQELVEAYMRFQSTQEQVTPAQELSDADVNQIKNAVGGEAAYEQLVGWAADNFSPQEIEAFDSVVESGNLGAINLALQALYYRYTDAMGFEGQTIQGKPARSQADVFRSQAEVVRAMSDPRYENDPAYRQDVFDKLERSELSF